MKVIKLDEFTPGVLATSLALGFFDGVHRGHQRILQHTAENGRKSGNTSAVFTFKEHPLSVICPSRNPPRLTTFEERLSLIDERGIKTVIWTEFDESFSKIRAAEFVRTVLVEKLGARALFIGPDYHYGFRAEGNVARLILSGKELGFQVNTFPPEKVGDDVVSSTLLRVTLSAGNVKKAEALLGRRYEITAFPAGQTNQEGSHGFITVSVCLDLNKLLPGSGVYRINARNGVVQHKALLHIHQRKGDHTPVALLLHSCDEAFFSESLILSFIEHFPEENLAAAISVYRRDD